jgi:hypothetical protein
MKQQVIPKSWDIFSKILSVTVELEWKSLISHIHVGFVIFEGSCTLQGESITARRLVVSTVIVLVGNCHMGCLIMAFVLSWCVPNTLKQIDLSGMVSLYHWTNMLAVRMCWNILWTCVYGCLLLLPFSPLFPAYTWRTLKWEVPCCLGMVTQKNFARCMHDNTAHQ